MKKRIAIFISGRGSNMEAIVKQTRNGILRGVCDVVAVFSNRPSAEGCKIAASYGIPAVSIPSRGKKREDFDREVIERMKFYRPDYIVLAGYMRLLSPVFIQAYPGRIINIHPADSRFYQGVEGYAWALRKSLPSTCITVHYVDEGMDTGEIIEQRELDIRGMETLKEVERAGLALEHKMYSEVLKKIFENDE